MSAALHWHAAHLGHVFRARTILPTAFSAAQRVVRLMSNSIPDRADYEHVNKVLTGEAHEPYPSAPPSSALFEDDTDEYAAFAPLSAPETSDSSTALNLMLREQLRERQIGPALSLLDELDAAGVPIQQDADFALVEQDEFRPEDARAFIRLWSNVPDYDRTKVGQPQAERFAGIMKLFFDQGTDIVQMSTFALLAASKGYGRFVGGQVISHLVRYASPEYAESFLEQLLEKVRRHPSSKYRYTSLRQWWYNLIIRGQTINLRPACAAQVLLRARNELRIKIDEGSYGLLLLELAKQEQNDLLWVIKRLARRDYPGHEWNIETDAAPDDLLGLATGGRLRDILLERQSDNSAALAMRGILDFPPHVGTKHIADFIEDCVAEGRQQVLDTIDNWANDSHIGSPGGRPAFWAGRWSTGVMLYFYRQRQHREVIKNYLHRFQVYGVPIEEIFVDGPDLAPSAPLQLWPAPFAQALLIKAMIWSKPPYSRDYERHIRLYEKWLRYFERCAPDRTSAHYRRPQASAVETPDDEEMVANNQIDLGDASFSPAAAHGLPTYTAWHHFVKWALWENVRRGRKFMLRVLHDMKRLGVPPGTILWTELLIQLVSQRHHRLAFYFADRMEGKEAHISDLDWPPEYRFLRDFQDNLPRPTVVMYGALLHRCMKTAVAYREWAVGALDAAQEVRQRMIQLGYAASPEHMQRTAAMFKDLDKILHWQAMWRQPEQQKAWLWNSLQRYKDMPNDKFEYDHNLNFVPRTGRFDCKENRLKRRIPGARTFRETVRLAASALKTPNHDARADRNDPAPKPTTHPEDQMSPNGVETLNNHAHHT
ncbi:hypothetical protein CALCODRAFT_506546 [Calocera cornea HHB12733]|uniref:Uncharacterized protein n=1 Tax=Calocera cornea HHB12733 TaxID=1353952 RepID=A0A165IS92_9BASI|nr:hypothetical protein CALCODRAFT_506546 [Calocera cornea HHB12733]